MSKNLSFENSINENKNEEFFAFVKDYNSLINKEENYESDKELIISAFSCLLMLEISISYLLKESISKNMILFGMLFMYVSCFGKTILGLFSSFLNRKQRKRDIIFIKEKSKGWLEFLKEKENKLNIARGLIIRLENLEKIKLNTFDKKNIDKHIKLKKEDIYHFVKYEVNESHFNEIENILIQLYNIENNTMELFKQEEELKQIKNEIQSGISNSSNSFKDNNKTTSFN